MIRGCVEIGARVRIGREPIESHLVAAPGASIRVGQGAQIGPGAALFAMSSIEIGEGAVLGPFAVVLDNDLHDPADLGSRRASRPLRIGARVVLGAHVTVLPGASIGDGTRVLAGSVVSRPLPEGVVAAGVPAVPLEAGSPWLA